MGFDAKKGLGTGLSGASIGSAAGPLGGVAGFAGGFLAGGFLGGEDGGSAYIPQQSAYESPTAQYVDNPDIATSEFPDLLPKKKIIAGSQWGVPGYWAKQGDRFAQDPDMRSIAYARARQQEGLNLARQQAFGQGSYAQAAAAAQSQRLRGQAHDAAMGGGPAGQVAAMRSAYGAQAGIGGKAMSAEASERQQKMGQYQAGLGALSKDESDMWKRQAAWQQAKSDMSAKFHTLGSAQKEAQRQAMMDLESLRSQLAAGKMEQDLKERGQWMGFFGELAKSAGPAIKASSDWYNDSKKG